LLPSAPQAPSARRNDVGSRPQDQARTSFRQAFRELVVAFGPLANELIIAERETIRLNTDLCWIDALAVTAPAASQDPLWATLPHYATANCSKDWMT